MFVVTAEQIKELNEAIDNLNGLNRLAQNRFKAGGLPSFKRTFYNCRDQVDQWCVILKRHDCKCPLYLSNNFPQWSW